MNKAFKPWRRGLNCWDANPFLAGVKPFSELYDTDGGGKVSSGYMWAIILYEQNDEEINPFYGLNANLKKEHVETHLLERFNEDLPLFVKGREVFPEIIMTAAQRDLKLHEENLKRQLELCRTTVLTFDAPDPNSKTRNIPGTAKQLASLQKSINQLFKELAALKEAFEIEKEEALVHGGRNETLSEKGVI